MADATQSPNPFKRKPPTVERLRELLRYDPETGFFTWLVGRGNQIKLADVAGGKSVQGYIEIRVDRVKYKAQNLAWLYMTGEWPPRFIDHLDCVRDNNRWSNLRLASRAENNTNRRLRSDNTSGLKGVGPFRGGIWRARITVGGTQKHLGYFASKEEAHAAYIAAARQLHGAFARIA